VIRIVDLKDGKPNKLTKGQEITVTTDYDIKGVEQVLKYLPVDEQDTTCGCEAWNVIVCSVLLLNFCVIANGVVGIANLPSL
jgi:hypothetical protein